MGSNRNFITIWIMFCVLNVQASSQTNPLNSFLYDYAFSAMHRPPRTGRLYEVTLPVNLTGVEVSVIRLRTHGLWRRGVNFGAVEIPATTLPSPFTRRVDIVYQNLGNWSSSYYNVPNYTLMTPVIGFLAYDSALGTINRHHQLVELNARGANPMIVRFKNVPEDVRMKCVRFSSGGSLEFSDVVGGVSCETRNQGHFSIVVPRRNRGNRVLKWWMVGIPLIVVFVLGIMGLMVFKWRRVGKMVKESEKSEGLETIWVGSSRMPAASGIRTQPILETSYVP